MQRLRFAGFVLLLLLLALNASGDPVTLVLWPLIFLHEMGHFLTARLFGLPIKRFAVGLGKIGSFRFRNIEWQLGLFPMCGWVEPGSLEDEDRQNAENRKDRTTPEGSTAPHSAGTEKAPAVPSPSLAQQWADEVAKFEKADLAQMLPPLRRLMFEAAGITVNLAVALLLLTVAFAVYGERTHANPLYVAKVAEGAETGLQVGDRIIAVDGQTIRNWEQLSWIVGSSRASEVVLQICRAGESLDLQLSQEMLQRLKLAPVPKGVDRRHSYVHQLQISGGPIEVASEPRSLPHAAQRAVTTSFGVAVEIMGSAPWLLTGQRSVFGFDGPHSTVSGTAVNASDGSRRAPLENYLLLAASFSIALGVLNLLPLPPLDGGRIVFSLLECIGLKLTSSTRLILLLIGGVFVLTSIFVVVILPIAKLIL